MLSIFKGRFEDFVSFYEENKDVYRDVYIEVYQGEDGSLRVVIQRPLASKRQQ